MSLCRFKCVDQKLRSLGAAALLQLKPETESGKLFNSPAVLGSKRPLRPEGKERCRNPTISRALQFCRWMTRELSSLVQPVVRGVEEPARPPCSGDVSRGTVWWWRYPLVNPAGSLQTFSHKKQLTSDHIISPALWSRALEFYFYLRFFWKNLASSVKNEHSWEQVVSVSFNVWVKKKKNFYE